jgi:hypothetical protein
VRCHSREPLFFRPGAIEANGFDTSRSKTKQNQDNARFAGSWGAAVFQRCWRVRQVIPDKVEVALEYPDKFYIGTFERSARFDAHLDDNGIALALYRSGDVCCLFSH